MTAFPPTYQTEHRQSDTQTSRDHTTEKNKSKNGKRPMASFRMTMRRKPTALQALAKRKMALTVSIICYTLFSCLIIPSKAWAPSPWRVVVNKSPHSRFCTVVYAHGRRTDTSRRKKKKNKYAKFSKTDNLVQDPLESLISESEEKIRELESESAKTKNTPLPRDNGSSAEKRVRNEILFPDVKSIDPYDPTTYGYTELGTILGAHGVRGLLKIASVTDFPERLCKAGVRHLKAQNRRSPRKVQLLDGRHRMGDEYLIKLEGIGDRDAANKLRGSVLYARQEERPEVGQDEYLISDLVGLDVFIEEGYGEDSTEDSDEAGLGGKFVGTVGGIVLAQDMCEIPGLGQDLLEVVLPRGLGGLNSWRDEMVLIPLVPQIVPRVEINEQSIFITPPTGLLDLKYIREEKVRIKGFLPPASEDE